VDFVQDNPGKPVPEKNIHPLTPIVVIKYLYLPPPSTAIHGILAIQSTSFTVFFHNLSPGLLGLPLGPPPSASYTIHFFTQSLSSFRSTCPYHRKLFCCSTKIMSSNPSLYLNSLLGTLSCSLMPHIHLTILISAL